MKILPDVGLTFDDVLLVPRFSNIKSRFDGEIDISTQLTPGVSIKYPILSANMDTITDSNLAIHMSKMGCLGVIHRFQSPENQAGQLFALAEKALHLLAAREHCLVINIGVGSAERDRLKTIYDNIPHKFWHTHWTSDESVIAVLIDIAHGHSQAMIEQIKFVNEEYNLPVIAGNIATYDAAMDLIQCQGLKGLKVGVGPGSLCSTRVQTGNGVPQLTAIMEVARAIYEVNKPISLIADGGIHNAGDCVKALAAGADAVMIGSLFAGCSEACGRTVRRNREELYKVYRGQASRSAQEDWKGEVKGIEGEETLVPFKGSSEEVVKMLVDGMLSGMSYQGARNIGELRKNAVFQRITQNGYKESIPHLLLTHPKANRSDFD